ncbi:MAG: CehA/McbA family metallohydrolase [Deltaproteobacteria bacterium]|nr:CehA/McbA family metallohydrolase [Deltaproteobacteria bacterium]
MRLRSFASLTLASVFLVGASLAASCSSDIDDTGPMPDPNDPCPGLARSFETGDELGHAEPFGARAAKQARAGRLTKESDLVQPAHGREQIRAGDYVLANDRIAVTIEGLRQSSGYAAFGGGVLAIDKVGEDGRPMGLSRYGETLMGVALELVNPTSVTVLADGSDGKAAIVRATGKLERTPFLDEGPLGALLNRRYGFAATYDYVLEPGSDKLTIRLGLINDTIDPLDFGVERKDSDELYGFFHGSQSQLVGPGLGYETIAKSTPWVGFDSGVFNFAWRSPEADLEFGIEQSGFSLFWGPGYTAEACSQLLIDRVELIAGGPDYDGLREAIRRVDGEEPWRAIAGKVVDGEGAPLEEAWLHLLSEDGSYLSRARTAADGSYTIHAPPGAKVKLVPQKRGYPTHAGVDVAADSSTADLAFGPTGKLHVTATRETDGVALPVRVQVIPKDKLADTPAKFGVLDEVNGRLHQEYVMNGDVTLTVPPGEHTVVVTRGFEYEAFEQIVTVTAGQTLEVPAVLAHSVDTTGVLCGDFHIHSQRSADSNDPIVTKVKAAIADGLDVPVSSEHEWVVDFGPVVKELGMEKWAFGMASEELTTFTWGHFGVIPITPRPDALNNGAVDWIGRDPAEVFGIVHALPEDPFLVVNHPSGASSFGAYFTAARLDRETGTSTDELWSDDFDGVEVFNDADFESNRDASVADWFALLNHGKTVWAIGSSDSHHVRTSPVGYPRTCMTFGHDDPTKLTPNAVRDSLRAGHATISGGLYMTVTGPNGAGPGDTVSVKDGKATFTVTVEGPSFMNADSLETIVNGVTVATETLLPIGSGPSKRYANEVTVSVDPKATRNWVVFHAKGEGDLAPLHPGKRPFAVSNPVILAK